MSWKLIQKNKKLLSEETGTIIKDPGGKTSIVLVYPNTYQIGMSNLAVHAIYNLLNKSDGIVCERAFFPEKKDLAEHNRTFTPILSIETQRSLADFDVIAFTVSFENDLLNIIPILERSRIPYAASMRGKEHPLLIAGGAAISLNPYPLAKIVDACITGEFETYHKKFISMLCKTSSKNERIHRLSEWNNTLVNSFSEKNKKSRTEAKSIRGPRGDSLDEPAQTIIHTSNTEFGSMHLVEVMRGCPRGCAFCATPSLYSPVRFHSFENILRTLKSGLAYRNKFGLIGADIISHPKFNEIAKFILDQGARFSLSSVRIDRINAETANLLFKAGMRSLSLGIEAGTERLRKQIGKNFGNERCMKSIAILANAGITNMKFYFMIGLPDEQDADVDAIIEFANQALKTIRENAPKTRRSSSVELTITPFVPKRLTAFAKIHFAGIERINEIQKHLKKKLGKNNAIKMSFDSAQQASIEAYLAKADENAIEFLKEAYETSPRKALKLVSSE